MKLPALGATLRRLGQHGAMDFYTGELAKEIAADLKRCGSPVTLEDLAAQKAQRREALCVGVKDATLYNFPPPTQGLASLMILAIFERLNIKQAETFEYLHGIVEATKQAFLVRDRIVGDPALMVQKAEDYLRPDDSRSIGRECVAYARVAMAGAGQSRRHGLARGDRQGWHCGQRHPEHLFRVRLGLRAAENSGIIWQNRGSSFLLEGNGCERAEARPQAVPYAQSGDGAVRGRRRMAYGNMGGEGQPQSQSAIFSRYAMFGQELQAAITAPRWLLGKTWGDATVTLKLEESFRPARGAGDARRRARYRNAGRLHLNDGSRRGRGAPFRRHVRGRHRPAERRCGDGFLTYCTGPLPRSRFRFAHWRTLPPPYRGAASMRSFSRRFILFSAPVITWRSSADNSAVTANANAARSCISNAQARSPSAVRIRL